MQQQPTSGDRPGLRELGEFGLIDRITDAVARTENGTVALGPGDDSAVVLAPDGRVVISTDVYVEGRHFRRDWSSAEDIGHRVAAAALADVSAMGAAPTALVIGLACPPDTDLQWLDGLTTGLADEAVTAGAQIAGGDISRADVVFISVTALGDLAGRPAVTRSGAVPGGVVAIAGTVGNAAAGLAILSRGFRAGKVYIEAHRRPQPPYAEGPRAAEAGALAMCDVSDGLLQDLGHIAAASGVLIDLDGAAFEIEPRMAEIASALGQDPRSWVYGGGDDHALVAAYPDRAHVPDGWRVIGSVWPVPEGGEPAVTIDGQAPELDGGWGHFAG